jgi:hypothetical protein
LITGRSHHAAPVGPAADDQRLAPQRRVVALFDRGVERVHVDVNDAANHDGQWQDGRIAGLGVCSKDDFCFPPVPSTIYPCVAIPSPNS